MGWLEFSDQPFLFLGSFFFRSIAFPAFRKRKHTFEAVLVQGHKGVTAAIVPFDPEALWGTRPVALDARRQGWLVSGTMNGAKLDGWIGLTTAGKMKTKPLRRKP